MRIGLFGGTFDPPHIGHLIVAQDVVGALELDELRFVVSAHPPHKPVLPLTDPEKRFRMVEEAIRGEPRFVADRVELDREGPSYTVDTLRALVGRAGVSEWHLVIGSDQFTEFEQWREPQEIVRLASLAVMSRPGWDSVGEPSFAGVRARSVPVTRVEVSSTDIRARVASGRPIRYLVPDRVRDFIEEYGLYRGPIGAPTE